MRPKIQVLIADDVAATRENIGKLLEFHPELAVAGQAATATEAVALAQKLQPDVIMMDINMPGLDGIAATEQLSIKVPNAIIIIMSVQGEQEYLRRAMLAGAKDYLVKPFTGDELVHAIKQAYDKAQQRQKVIKLEPMEPVPGKVITVFSTKGGIGKTTIATNLAVALARKTGQSVGIVDADLQFGDVALFLNLTPQATLFDLIQDIDQLDGQVLDSYLTAYDAQVKVLSAPLRPEQAETVTGSHLTSILKVMRSQFAYIIVDTAPSFNDTMLAVLDAADQVLMVSAMDLPTIKNVKLGLEIMESLHYGQDKIKSVLNRADSEGGMDVREVEESLHYPFTATLPSDGKTVTASVNRGVPFVVSNPEAPVAQSIFNLARIVADGDWQPGPTAKGVMGRLKQLFG